MTTEENAGVINEVRRLMNCRVSVNDARTCVWAATPEGNVVIGKNWGEALAYAQNPANQPTGETTYEGWNRIYGNKSTVQRSAPEPTDAECEAFVNAACPDGINYRIQRDEETRDYFQSIARYALRKIAELTKEKA